MANIHNSGEIRLKTHNQLNKKEFFEPKANKYRVKKLINLVDIISKPDFDIELDELKFTKLKKYKDYSLIKLTNSELKKIIKNYDFKEDTYLDFIGIVKLDKDSYSLQLDIFLDKFIRINLKEITFQENVDIIFKMFDKENLGRINKNQAYNLIFYFHEINSLAFDNNTVNAISEAIFKHIDKSNQGYITKVAMSKYLEKYQEEDITINPFIKIKTSEAVTRIKKNQTEKISSDQVKILDRINRKKDRSKFKKFWVLNKKMIIWTTIYLVLCLTAGIVNRSLEKGRQYDTTKAARFFAGIIFINLSILIIFMCDATNTLLNSTRLRFYLPLNDTKLYHAVCACVLGISSLIHVSIHLFGDFVQIAAKCAPQPAKSYVTVAWLTFANLTGLTGVFCLILFSIIIIIPLIRPIINKRYELFLKTHKLFYPALIVLLLHANTPDTNRWPYFVFLVLPLLLFTIELIIRLFRYFMNKVIINNIKYLNSGVVLLEIQKPKSFNFKCGQYAQVNIPNINKWQWHPFTIASSPHDDSLYFYVNPVGDWTNDLKNLANNKFESLIIQNVESKVNKLLSDQDIYSHVDGPHGAPAENFNNYENLIFVAAGVGATPFSSILIELLYKLKKREKLYQKSIAFYWIQRDYGKADYLNNILDEISKEDKEKLFEINLFITCAQQKYDLRSIFIADGIDLIKKDTKIGNTLSQLCSSNVYWGRPEWDIIFKKKALIFRENESNKVGVFVCGNNYIVSDIYEVCENYSSAAVKFELNTEHF